MSLGRGMHRSYINHGFLTVVIDTLIDKGQHTQNDQHNPNHNDRFHTFSFPTGVRLHGPAERQ